MEVTHLSATQNRGLGQQTAQSAFTTKCKEIYKMHCQNGGCSLLFTALTASNQKRD